MPMDETTLESTLEIFRLSDRTRRVVYRTRGHFEAPNWSRDGRELLFNSQGRLYAIPIEGGEPRLVDAGFAVRCLLPVPGGENAGP